MKVQQISLLERLCETLKEEPASCPFTTPDWVMALEKMPESYEVPTKVRGLAVLMANLMEEAGVLARERPSPNTPSCVAWSRKQGEVSALKALIESHLRLHYPIRFNASIDFVEGWRFVVC